MLFVALTSIYNDTIIISDIGMNVNQMIFDTHQ